MAELSAPAVGTICPDKNLLELPFQRGKKPKKRGPDIFACSGKTLGFKRKETFVTTLVATACLYVSLPVAASSASAAAPAPPAPAAQAAGARPAGQTIYIREYRVMGVHMLTNEEVEEAVYPYLGPGAHKGRCREGAPGAGGGLPGQRLQNRLSADSAAASEERSGHVAGDRGDGGAIDREWRALFFAGGNQKAGAVPGRGNGAGFQRQRRGRP